MERCTMRRFPTLLASVAVKLLSLLIVTATPTRAITGNYVKDTERRLFAKQLAGHRADGAVSAGGNDDLVAPGYRVAGGGDRLFLRAGHDDLFAKPREVLFHDGPHLILRRGVGRDTGFLARIRVDQHANPRSGVRRAGI